MEKRACHFFYKTDERLSIPLTCVPTRHQHVGRKVLRLCRVKFIGRSSATVVSRPLRLGADTRHLQLRMPRLSA